MQPFARPVKKNADGTVADKVYRATVLAKLPVGYWRFRETSGTNVDDEVDANGAAEHDGTLSGSGTILGGPSPILGDSTARSFIFNGSGYVHMGDNFDFAGLAPFSVVVWVMPSQLDGVNRRLFSKEITDGGGFQGWGLYARAGVGLNFYRYLNGVGDEVGFSTGLSVGTWQMATVVYTGSQMFIYVNRSQVAGPVASSRALVNHAGQFRVGFSSAGEGFMGDVAEPAVFDYALTEQQIQDIYDVGIAAAGYSYGDVESALKSNRRESFRHELHRYTVPQQIITSMDIGAETWLINAGNVISFGLDQSVKKLGSASLMIESSAAAPGYGQVRADIVPDLDMSNPAYDELRFWVKADPNVSQITPHLDSTSFNFTNYYYWVITKAQGKWTPGTWTEVRVKWSDAVIVGSPTRTLITRALFHIAVSGTGQGRVYIDDFRAVNSAAVAWSKIADLTGVVSCQIEYNRLGRVKRTASYRIIDDGQIDWARDTIRSFWSVQMPDGYWAEWQVGTFYVSSPTHLIAPGSVRDVAGYDSLLALEQAKLSDWLSLPTGANPVAQVVSLILNYATTLVAGYLIPPTTKTLAAPRVFEPGETVLTVCNELLAYCGYTSLRANEDGSFVAEPYVLPSIRSFEFTYMNDAFSVIVAGSVELTNDLFDAPNQWVRVVSRPEGGPLRAVAAITDPANPLSQAYRGRLITDYNTLDAPDQATLNATVLKLAEEGQFVFTKWKLETPLMPHGHADVVALIHTQAPAEDLGVYMEHSWTMDLKAGGKMTHNFDKITSAAALGT